MGILDVEQRGLAPEPPAVQHRPGAVRVHGDERPRQPLALEQSEEDAAGQPRRIEQVAQHAQLQVQMEIAALALEPALIRLPGARVRSAPGDRRRELDLLRGVVGEQQHQLIEAVGQHLELPALAQLQGQLAPLGGGGGVQAQRAVAEEHGADGAPGDRLEEVKGAGLELEVEDVAVEDQAVHRRDPAVRARAAQRRVGRLGSRRGRGGAGERGPGTGNRRQRRTWRRGRRPGWRRPARRDPCRSSETERKDNDQPAACAGRRHAAIHREPPESSSSPSRS